MNYPLLKSSLVLLMLKCSSSFCQQNLNVCGHTASINGFTFEYSIGEMTCIRTARNANLLVTQGILQPNRPGVNGSTAEGEPQTATGNTGIALSESMNVYPNPTRDVLYVESNAPVDAEIAYQLFDAQGRTIINKSYLQKAGPYRFSLDLQPFAAGSYFLLVQKPNGNGIRENISYKIQKTN